ncbi:MAG TPA: hypothetical protein VHY80_13900 [Stellaceae bacterium]|jgi:hypothetical protein|nr:hypothetical protein [Stellaceae bacterium]
MAIYRLLAIAVAFGLALGAAHTASAFQLITNDEAKLPAAPVVQIATRGLTRGPTVDQVAPAPNATVPNGALEFDVTFAPHNGATIDPSKVRITYLKQPEIDLTQRLKSYITPKGIDAKDVTIPPGTHMIRVEVTDSDGRSTSQIMKIQVASN